ncbi:MAG: TetR/AcrR family transcriptional regulator [Solirubrobacterales bacterium]|nr:TetR/AcrR family transcriptional regulator [Solirubrobacterales bacterium]
MTAPIPDPRPPAPRRRSQLLVAAATLFAERGYAATRLDDVAAAAGVTKPIVYRHFASKKELYLALLRRHSDDLPRFLADGEIPSGASDEELARAVLDRWLEYVRDNRHAWLMLFRDSGGDGEIRAYRSAVAARARAVLVAFIDARSTLPAAQVEPTAELLRSALAGLALWWIDNPGAAKEDVLAVALRAAVAVADDGAA